MNFFQEFLENWPLLTRTKKILVSKKKKVSFFYFFNKKTSNIILNFNDDFFEVLHISVGLILVTNDKIHRRNLYSVGCAKLYSKSDVMLKNRRLKLNRLSSRRTVARAGSLGRSKKIQVAWAVIFKLYLELYIKNVC